MDEWQRLAAERDRLAREYDKLLPVSVALFVIFLGGALALFALLSVLNLLP